MKKIISFALILTMLVSIFAMNTSAAGILVQSDFNDMERFTQSFHAGAYYTEDNLLFGYAEALCLQSKSEHYIYDTSIEVCFNDDELSENERGYSLWYCNINLDAYGRYDGTNYMRFGYDIENQCFYLVASDLETEETYDLVPRVPYTLEDDKFYTFGYSVTRGRLRGFIDNTLVIDYVDTNDSFLIGLEDDGTSPTPLVYWNDGNFIQIKSVTIASAEYLFPVTPVTDNSNTAPNNTPTTTKATSETTTRKEVVDVTDDKGNAVTDDKGNKVTEEIIITEPPVADTNTNAGVGGNSATTGDKAVMVVAAMVVALGCAFIVKKVND